MRNQLYSITKIFLHNLNINILDSELKLQILSHPSYPSLHALTGVLDHFKINNLALEVDQDLETLRELPKVFLSLIGSENNKEFAVVKKQKNNIEIEYSNKKKIFISITEFLNIWSGIIVVAEKGDTEIENIKDISKNVLNTLCAISVIFILGFFFFFKPTLFQSIHFILSLIGVVISFLILKHELGFQSKTIDKFCNKTKTTSCDAVLNSKGATILKYYKLSDLTLIYFLSLTLFWLLLINTDISDSTIVTLSLIAVIVTFYSIYYQYTVIKKWCPLCLGIVVVLWLQCSVLFLENNVLGSIKFDLISNFIFFFSFTFTSALWLFVKPLLYKEQDLKKLQLQHYKFKRNFDLFNALYSNSNAINTGSIHKAEIVLGNKHAPLHLLLVTNPQCFYCKSAHTDLESILNKYPDSIKVTIRFSVNTKDKNNLVYKVTSRLIELYNSESEIKCLEALNEAYKNEAKLDNWLIDWKEAANDDYGCVLELQQTWCHNNAINFTPALYINDRIFPKEYERSDISYFVEDLIEQAENETTFMNPDQIKN